MNEIDDILSNIDKEEEDDLIRQAHDLRDIDTLGVPGETIGDMPGDKNQEELTESEILVGESPEMPAPSEMPETPFTGGPGFVMRGTKTWNTREPYTIKVTPEALRKNRADLHQSFYFVDEPSGTDEIQQKIKQEIVTFLRKPNEGIIDRYSDFIHKLIIVNMQSIGNDFELNQDNEKLFIYHLGPLTVYKILKEGFILKKFGFCYKYLPGNKAVRFFPAEFVKETILGWFTENIQVFDLPYDSIQKYEEVRYLAQKNYQNDLRVFNMRLDQLNAKIRGDKTISRGKLFQLKGAQWFGFQNIEIYRRFLGNAVFT